MPGTFLKGAFVQFIPTFLVPVPNIVMFQYNPETMTHTWAPAAPEMTAAGSKPNPLAVNSLPGESFQFNLMMDSSDTIADGNPATAGVAQATGLYSRLAALEMLLYPSGSFSAIQLLGTVSSALDSAGKTGLAPDKAPAVPQYMMPVVLFVWGPGRIVPVRITSLTITEKLYDAQLLNPTQAEAQIGIQVLTPDEVAHLKPQSLQDIATVAYDYSQGLRQALAVENVVNVEESIIGMLPVG
jgi:hypothetical protein